MRTTLLTALVSLLFLGACKNKSESTTKDKDTAQVKSMTATDERTARADALKKMTVMPLEKIQQIMPAEIDGAKQSNFNNSMQWGYGYATAEYNKTKAEGIQVTIYDCAGEEGSAYYLNNFYDKLNQDKQDSSEYTKTIDFMGSKAMEFYNKDLNYSTLTYMVDGHLMVQLQGKKKTVNDLKAVAQKINLKTS